MTAVLLVFAIVLFVTVCLVIISIYRADKIAKDKEKEKLSGRDEWRYKNSGTD